MGMGGLKGKDGVGRNEAAPSSCVQSISSRFIMHRQEWKGSDTSVPPKKTTRMSHTPGTVDAPRVAALDCLDMLLSERVKKHLHIASWGFTDWASLYTIVFLQGVGNV